MHILWKLAVGFVVGVLARLITPGRGPAGVLTTLALGIAGAFVGPYVGERMHFYASTQLAVFIASVAGAVGLLLIYHAFRDKPD